MGDNGLNTPASPSGNHDNDTDRPASASPSDIQMQQIAHICTTSSCQAFVWQSFGESLVPLATGLRKSLLSGCLDVI